MQKPTGTTFIEVLISLFIISFILLGMVALQLVSLQKSKSAYYFSVAAEQMISMKERIYSMSEPEIDNQFLIWNKQNQDLLPQGRGVISGRFPTYLISIFWGNTNETECIKSKTGPSGCLSLSIKKIVE